MGEVVGMEVVGFLDGDSVGVLVGFVGFFEGADVGMVGENVTYGLVLKQEQRTPLPSQLRVTVLLN